MEKRIRWDEKSGGSGIFFKIGKREKGRV